MQQKKKKEELLHLKIDFTSSNIIDLYYSQSWLSDELKENEQPNIFKYISYKILNPFWVTDFLDDKKKINYTRNRKLYLNIIY